MSGYQINRYKFNSPRQSDINHQISSLRQQAEVRKKQDKINNIKKIALYGGAALAGGLLINELRGKGKVVVQVIKKETPKDPWKNISEALKPYEIKNPILKKAAEASTRPYKIVAKKVKYRIKSSKKSPEGIVKPAGRDELLKSVTYPRPKDVSSIPLISEVPTNVEKFKGQKVKPLKKAKTKQGKKTEYKKRLKEIEAARELKGIHAKDPLFKIYNKNWKGKKSLSHFEKWRKNVEDRFHDVHSKADGDIYDTVGGVAVHRKIIDPSPKHIEQWLNSGGKLQYKTVPTPKIKTIKISKGKSVNAASQALHNIKSVATKTEDVQQKIKAAPIRESKKAKKIRENAKVNKEVNEAIKKGRSLSEYNYTIRIIKGIK